MPVQAVPPGGFWVVLLGRWKVLATLIVGGLVPWLGALFRDWLAQAGLEWAWGSIGNPAVASLIGWMAVNPVPTAMLGAVVWLLAMATASHLHVRRTVGRTVTPSQREKQTPNVPVASSGKPEERVFIVEPVESVLAVPPDATGLHVQRTKAVYRGKWLRVSAPLNSLMFFESAYEPFYQVTLQGKATRRAYLYFLSEWGDRLEHLKPGQLLTVVGRVQEIDATATLHLEHCELESVAPASPQTEPQASALAMPEKRPKLAPIAYGHRDADGMLSVAIKNQAAEPAYDVQVPELTVGDSTVVFEAGPNYLAPGDEWSCQLYAMEPHGVTLDPDVDGFLEAMKRGDIRDVEVPIYYRDFDNNWFVTRCTLQRGAWFSGGIGVGPFRQERIAGRPQPG